MPTRRAVIMGGLVLVGLPPDAGAQTSLAGAPAYKTAPLTILQLQRRTIEVNGKAASVFGIRQPDGTVGIRTSVDQPFNVRVETQRPTQRCIPSPPRMRALV